MTSGGGGKGGCSTVRWLTADSRLPTGRVREVPVRQPHAAGMCLIVAKRDAEDADGAGSSGLRRADGRSDFSGTCVLVELAAQTHSWLTL